VNEFRRSGRFGLVGVGVVAVLVAAIALLFGSGANPTGALIAILVVIFGFVGAFMYLQRRDLDSATSAAARDSDAAPVPVTDPAQADRISLLADLATGPLDRDALAAADSQVWGIARRSVAAGPPMMVLIFCAVVPWLLFQWIWSLVIFAPLIVIYAIYLTARMLVPGGGLDQAYDASEPTLKALGLSETDRPKVEIHSQAMGPQPLRHEVVGASAYAGERHGRAVTVTIAGGSTVTVGGAVTPFEVRASDEHLRAAARAPSGVEAALAPLRGSGYWKDVTFTGGANGVVAERERDGAENWLRDLWVAERLADGSTSHP
jgi:hypothetical protein